MILNVASAIGGQSSVTTLDNKTVAQYEYDEEGLRTKKIIGSKTYEYFYDGEDDNLTVEVTKENNQIQRYRFYQWDENGKVIGMIIKEKNSSGSWVEKAYYFLTNQRGDVVSIVDSNGTEVGSYTYDSFGNLISENGTIAKENFIRYASYYYDSETKHYYLKARYYDPINGNFLALDPHPGDEDDSLSQNGYTYAGNSPVMQVDPDGDFFWLAVNVGWAAYSGYRAYKRGGWKSAAIAAGIGLVGGAAWKVGKVAYKAYRLGRVHKAPAHVKSTLSHVLSRNGAAPRGHVGGRTYHNNPKSKKAWKLPRDSYKEYDVHPKVKGVNRGKERIVVGSKRAYYTKNHYKTFRRIR